MKRKNFPRRKKQRREEAEERASTFKDKEKDRDLLCLPPRSFMGLKEAVKTGYATEEEIANLAADDDHNLHGWLNRVGLTRWQRARKETESEVSKD